MRIPLLTGLLFVSAWTTHADTLPSGGQETVAQSVPNPSPTTATAPTASATGFIFDSSSFPLGNGQRIYVADTSLPSVVHINISTTRYDTIQLYIRTNNGDNIVESRPKSTENQSSGNGYMQISNTLNGQDIDLNLEAIVSNITDHPLFFALKASTSAVVMSGDVIVATSPLFGVVNDVESDTSGFKGYDLTGLTAASIQSGSSPASSTGSSKTSSSDSFNATASPSSSNTSGHGLATGAIAGIAVGAAVVLILIIAAIWFTLRHRKQRALSHPADATTPLAAGYGGAAAAAVSRDFMAEKEAGAVVAESPQSRTYTDQLDPQHSAILSRAAVTAGPIAGPANASYTESGHQAYDDVGRALTDHQPPHASASSGRGLDSPVPEIGVARHLVDDDMTADEIARLEEEERELDRQIQEAGRRRR